MKTNKQFFAKGTIMSFVAATTMLFSCNKSEVLTEAPTVTEEEAAEVIVQSMSAQSGGLILQTESTASVVARMSYECGKTEDTSYVRESAQGASVTYKFELDIVKQLNCEMGFPQNLVVTADAHTTYSGPRMSSDDNSQTEFMVTGFNPQEDYFNVTIDGVRRGSQQSKVRAQRSFNSELTVKSTDVLIDKSTGIVGSGTIQVHFTGELSTGKTVEYDATIILKGNKEAIVAFSNNATYEFSWK